MAPVPPAGDSPGDLGAGRGAVTGVLGGCFVIIPIVLLVLGFSVACDSHRSCLKERLGHPALQIQLLSCALLSSCAGVKQEADPERNGARHADPARRVDARAGVQAAAHAAEAANGPDPAAAPD